MLHLAADNAQRMWRQQQLSGLLANVAQRSGLYVRLRDATRRGDRAKAAEYEEKLRDTWPSSDIGWAGFGVFHSLVSAYQDADIGCLQFFSREPAALDSDEYQHATAAHIGATRELQQAVERYIFSGREALETPAELGNRPLPNSRPW